MTHTADILTRHDRGAPVSEIANALAVSESYVYGILREHRPNRERKQHRKWSPYRDEIRKLHGRGKSAAEIAETLKIERATVYKHLPKAPPPCPVPRP